MGCDWRGREGGRKQACTKNGVVGVLAGWLRALLLFWAAHRWRPQSLRSLEPRSLPHLLWFTALNSYCRLFWATPPPNCVLIYTLPLSLSLRKCRQFGQYKRLSRRGWEAGLLPYCFRSLLVQHIHALLRIRVFHTLCLSQVSLTAMSLFFLHSLGLCHHRCSDFASRPPSLGTAFYREAHCMLRGTIHTFYRLRSTFAFGIGSTISSSKIISSTQNRVYSIYIYNM